MKAAYEHIHGLCERGMEIHFFTNKGEYLPAHWHPAIEMIHILNGTARITLEGKTHILVSGDLLIVDSSQIHESHCSKEAMGIYIHVTREFLKPYMKDIDQLRLQCSRNIVKKEQMEAYLVISDLFKELAPLYIRRPAAYRLQTEAISMNILFELINHFAVPADHTSSAVLPADQERMKAIINYIEMNHDQKISLEEIASYFGLSREYFSRLFKQTMGITFTRHLNRVRITHIYHSICTTQEPVMNLLEMHGFTNYKLFLKMFRELYGDSPRGVRKKAMSETD